MRRFLLASTLVLSACATAPQQPQPQPQTTQVTPAQPQTRRLLGLTAQELVGNLGNPQLQVREGNSLKLQFRSSNCVLDAYLYPSGSSSGPLRVTYVETRTPGGAGTDQAACISAFEHPI
jgi:FtsP/CotA-like multicopper oxidase with cupredoxin domain